MLPLQRVRTASLAHLTRQPSATTAPSAYPGGMRDGATGIGALVPAAGRSVRFGTDKRRVETGEGPMLETLVRRCAGAFERVLVVLREGDEALARRLEASGPGVKAELSRRADRGMGDSIADGVLATRGWRAWFIALGDMPFVASRTLEALRDAMAERLREAPGGPVIVQPVHGAVGGNPVGFSHHYAEALLALRGDRGARGVLERSLEALIRVPVDDPGIHRDVDTPADLARALVASSPGHGVSRS
jgi:molybdenum cofactor cytidylyltransferase